jgi:23S rRNA (cytidine1920-2'-O)/16S rRNA (cytidine1409-2'-O)-methyltransferase
MERWLSGRKRFTANEVRSKILRRFESCPLRHKDPNKYPQNLMMQKQHVSRAGQKLQHAITEFKIDITNKICADFGCSTGGFVDCLLQNGADKVYAVDTGYGVLDWNLRNNPKVIAMERTNALHVELPEQVDIISIDVGWTKQKLIIPSAKRNLKEDGIILSLLKPHYEAEKKWYKGERTDESVINETVEKVKGELIELGLVINDIVKSPIVGKKGGNTEFVMWITKK